MHDGLVHDRLEKPLRRRNHARWTLRVLDDRQTLIFENLIRARPAIGVTHDFPHLPASASGSNLRLDVEDSYTPVITGFLGLFPRCHHVYMRWAVALAHAHNSDRC